MSDNVVPFPRKPDSQLAHMAFVDDSDTNLENVMVRLRQRVWTANDLPSDTVEVSCDDLIRVLDALTERLIYEKD